MNTLSLAKEAKIYSGKKTVSSTIGAGKTRQLQISFLSNPKERQCQRKFKLPHNCTYFTGQQVMLKILQVSLQQYVNLRNSRCSNWIQKRQRNQISNCQHLLDHRKSKRISEQISTSASLTILKPLTKWIITNCGTFLKRWEYLTSFPGS